ncbi:cobalamin biosynthesis protein [Rhodobacteraceae bacterium N5(2021)]|uniref:Cobalamin biosynthesis protein n=2 Tax=Gymnodinialimonas phycosphaerae TaxID=2841589 RepID=A0A975TZA8_9RHOB|nr:cobalamin biosynthesis protein [Gymnodinialimonas phycosphaerae]MBY4892767.1 cobalamin biosynthesis protein [Gymnodinialimonas phycosphaerae]
MIAAGFGFRASATVDSLRDAFARAGDTADTVSVGVFATAHDKAGAEALVALAHDLGLRVIGLPEDTLIAQTTLTQSQASRSARQTGSVAEAAALAAAGPGAQLLAARVVSADRMATCALAQGDPI